MRTGSALKRFCAYPAILDLEPPRTAAERTREANKRASADRGTLGHALFEGWCLGQVSHSEDPELQGYLDCLAAQWRPPGTFEAEVPWGLDAGGNYVEVIEHEPHVYVARPLADGGPLPFVLTAGRADAVWVSDATPAGPLLVVDWKFGKWPVDPARVNLQVNAAGMALALRSFCRAYIPGIYYARDGVFDWGDPVAVGSPEWKAMFEEIKAAALLDDKPHPGDHCGKCWSRSRCPSAI